MWFHWGFLVRRHLVAGNSRHHFSHHLCRRGGFGPVPKHPWSIFMFHQSRVCVARLRIHILCFMFVVDRRGESEESGDDETRRRSINGDVDPNQPTSTSKSSALQPKMKDLWRCFHLELECKVRWIADITGWALCCFAFYPKAVCWCDWRIS